MSTREAQKQKYAPQIYDAENDNPDAIVNLVPDEVAKAIRSIPVEYLRMKENLLHNRVNPEKRDYRIRLAFWHEYDRYMDGEVTKLFPHVFLRGVCSLDYFQKKFLVDKKRVAWMVTPPADYSVMTEEALTAGLERMREVLELGIKTPKGLVDHKLIKEQFAIVQFLDNRVKGSIAKQVEVRQATVRYDANQGTGDPGDRDTPRDIDVEIQEMERRLKGEPLAIEGEVVNGPGAEA